MSLSIPNKEKCQLSFLINITDIQRFNKVGNIVFFRNSLCVERSSFVERDRGDAIIICSLSVSDLAITMSVLQMSFSTQHVTYSLSLTLVQ